MDRSLDRHLFDRRLYLTAAAIFPLIVLLGFARTYYVKAWFATPPLPSAIVHVHALVMTAWVLLFVVQVRLIAAKQIHLHQRLGYAGIGLGALIILTGLPTALRAGKYGSLSNPAGIPPLAFMIVPMFDLLMFVVFFSAAIYYRRKAASHKALMLLTVLNFLPPAIARIPVTALQSLGPLWFFGLPTALALIALGLERRRYGRINRVLATGTALLVASYFVRLTLMPTAAWRSVALWMTSFV